MTCSATKSAHLGSSLNPLSSSETPATSMAFSSACSGSRSETTAQDPPSGSVAVVVCVVVEPFSSEVKSSLVASKVIDDGATTSTVLRPASPTP